MNAFLTFRTNLTDITSYFSLSDSYVRGFVRRQSVGCAKSMRRGHDAGRLLLDTGASPIVTS